MAPVDDNGGPFLDGDMRKDAHVVEEEVGSEKIFRGEVPLQPVMGYLRGGGLSNVCVPVPVSEG